MATVPSGNWWSSSIFSEQGKACLSRRKVAASCFPEWRNNVTRMTVLHNWQNWENGGIKIKTSNPGSFTDTFTIKIHIYVYIYMGGQLSSDPNYLIFENYSLNRAYFNIIISRAKIEREVNILILSILCLTMDVYF